MSTLKRKQTKCIITMALAYEEDLVLCRQRVRRIAEHLSFDRQEQTRIATAVSEIIRNAFEYGKDGKVEISIDDNKPQNFLITIRDSGRGISQLENILSGKYVSKTGMGLGILGTKRLMEIFQIESGPTGTKVILGKPLPKGSGVITQEKLLAISSELTRNSPQNPFQEVQEQNQELLQALEEIQQRQFELAKLNQELEETNRGVVALYAELDDKAASLKRASEAKTTFLSNMTHEFRTPLNSILGLSRAALSEEDGPLNEEHKKQIKYIVQSAETLSELVNDLLDIAKVEAGKIEIRRQSFDLTEFLGGLRGVLKPLVRPNSGVELSFEIPSESIQLYTDEGKLGQILRNLVSNALKYTESGSVTVSTEVDRAGLIRFKVADTGIGIAGEDHDRIFDEFIQIESPMQNHLKGTGLGLPLSRKLANLLGGEITIASEVGQGSVFTLEIPQTIGASPESFEAPLASAGLTKTGFGSKSLKILIIDDEEIARYLLKELLPFTEVTILEVSDGFEGIRIACSEKPDLIFLDLQMPKMSGFYVLELLKSNPLTKLIPVIVNTAMTLNSDERKNLEKYTVAIISKNEVTRDLAKARVLDALSHVQFLGTPELSEAQNG